MLKRIIVLMTLVLAACGGGGGSGGGSSSQTAAGGGQSLRFGAVLSGPINAKFTDGNIAYTASPTVSVAYSGTTNQPLVIVIEDPDQVFSTANVLSVANGVGTLDLKYSPSLKAGTYTSDLKIHACASAQMTTSSPPVATCVGEYAGSPVIVPRKIVVDSIQLDKYALDFVANGATSATAQKIIVSGGTDPSLILSGLNGSLSGKIAYHVNGNEITISPLPVFTAGNYTDTLYVTAPGFKEQQVKISYTVISPELAHGITVDEAYATQLANVKLKANSTSNNFYKYLFWYKNNSQTQIQSVTVDYLGARAINWINLLPYSANSNYVSLWLTNLNAGFYDAKLVITSNTNGIIDVYRVPVSMQIE